MELLVFLGGYEDTPPLYVFLSRRLTHVAAHDGAALFYGDGHVLDTAGRRGAERDAFTLRPGDTLVAW